MNSKWRIEDGRWLHLFFDDKWRHNDNLLPFKIINVLSNFVVLSDTLLFRYLPFYGCSKGKN